MAKSGKHKKLRKQEKAKTQLKGGLKTLGKAKNVIEPKLQSKKIVLREQLKSTPEDEVPTTKRKQSLADVLASLSHHNTNMKVDALNGLYELITTGTNVLESNLGRIVDKVGLLTSDLESSVRKENLRVAEALFSQVSESQLQPFWNLLVTHLKCTLTDLNPAVRQSCLSFISLLLTSCPNLVRMSRSTILPAVLNLISNPSSSAVNSSMTPSTSSATTRLKLDISDKASEMKERTRVLSLIASCLDLKSASSASSCDNDQQFQELTEEYPLNGRNAIHLNLYFPFGYDGTEMRGTSGRHSSSRCDPFASTLTQQQSYNGTQFMGDFIRNVFPVLCESWIEVAPSTRLLKSSGKSKNRQGELKENDTGGSHLNKTAVDILECVVNVMTQVIRPGGGYAKPGRSNGSETATLNKTDVVSIFRPAGIKREDNLSYGIDEKLLQDLKKTFGLDLQKFFFHFLPFSCSQESQRQTLIKINLQLFNVAAQFRLFDRQLMDKFEKYVNGMINKGNALSSDLVSLVLETASMVRSPKIGDLSTKFIAFASTEPGCQASVCHFLQKILAPNSADSHFIAAVDWTRVTPLLMDVILHEEQPQMQSNLINVLTLLALRNLDSVGKMVEENLASVTDKFLHTDSRMVDAIKRLLFYAISSSAELLDVSNVNLRLDAVLQSVRT